MPKLEQDVSNTHHAFVGCPPCFRFLIYCIQRTFMTASNFQRPQLIRDEVYAFLRREIFLGHLEPETPLREQELSERLQVSRTPVREALNQLLQEGLLAPSQHNARGLQIKRYSRKEALDIYDVRALLEGMSANLAARATLSNAQLTTFQQRLWKLLDKGDSADAAIFIEDDLALHTVIAELSGNHALLDSITRLGNRLLSLRAMTRIEISSQLSQDQHQQIVEAIVARDPEKAETAMREHIHTFKNILANNLKDG